MVINGSYGIPANHKTKYMPTHNEIEKMSMDNTFLDCLAQSRHTTPEERKAQSDEVWNLYLEKLTKVGDIKETVFDSELWDHTLSIGTIFRTIATYAGPKELAKLLQVNKTMNSFKYEVEPIWRFFATGLYTQNSITINEMKTTKRRRSISCIVPRRRNPDCDNEGYTSYGQLVRDCNRLNVWRAAALWHYPMWRRRHDVGPARGFVGNDRRNWGKIIMCSIDYKNDQIALHVEAYYETPFEILPAFLKSSGLLKYKHMNPLSHEMSWQRSVTCDDVVFYYQDKQMYRAIFKFPIKNAKPLPRTAKQIEVISDKRVYSKKELAILEQEQFWEGGANYFFQLGNTDPGKSKYEQVPLFQIDGIVHSSTTGDTNASKSTSKNFAIPSSKTNPDNKKYTSMSQKAFDRVQNQERFGPNTLYLYARKTMKKPIERNVEIELVDSQLFGSEYFMIHNAGHRRDPIGWLFPFHKPDWEEIQENRI